MWQQGANSGGWIDWQAQETMCKGMQHDQVDWAALAQQWISMKDVGVVSVAEEEAIPQAPPPPTIRNEDTMEIEDDVQNPLIFDVQSGQHKGVPGGPESWQRWDARHDSDWSGNQQWTASQAYANMPAIAAAQQQQVYWTASGNNYRHSQQFVPPLMSLNVPAPRSTAKPLAFLKQERQSLMNEVTQKSDDDFDANQDAFPMLDAVKRRQLPAWIREGLEKVEREKLKKQQLELQRKEREEKLRKEKEEEDQMRREAEEKGVIFVPKKSKFESDNESDSESESMNPVEPFRVKLEKEKEAVKLEPPVEEPVFKSKEEILQELMMKMKRTLTEILLDVTTAEMNAVAREEITRARKKASKSVLVKEQALQSLTGKLGLGLYADSGSDSDSDEEETSRRTRRQSDSSDDDDDKIKLRIQRCRSAFAVKEVEIERQNRELERRTARLERRFLGEESGDSESEEEKDTERITQQASFCVR